MATKSTKKTAATEFEKTTYDRPRTSSRPPDAAWARQVGALELMRPRGEKSLLTRPKIDFSHEVRRLYGMPLDVSPTVKTFGPFQGVLRYANGDPIGTLDDLRISVVRLVTSPGQAFISLSLEYYANSAGSRTGGIPGEALMPPQYVYFRDASGFQLFTWDAGFFSLDCGWQKMHQIFGRTGMMTDFWFDAAEQVEHSITGTFYRC